MKYFKEREFVCKCSQDSQARMNSCELSCGQLPPSVRANIVALVDNVLDPARGQFGGPVVVNSGYRCQKHNLEVGGAVNSQHMKGEAADIRFQGPGFKVQDLAKAIVANGTWDQLILYPTFVHVSYKRGGGNRKEILKKTSGGYVKMSINDLK